MHAWAGMRNWKAELAASRSIETTRLPGRFLKQLGVKVPSSK